MNDWTGRTAVITGAASGFGLEASRIAARCGMNVVLADVQPEALDLAAREIEGLGAKVLPFRLDVAKPAEVDALGAATLQRFGAPSFVFNNAGVGSGGLVWENTAKDWDWVVGVNLMGVAHGVRVFAPMMLAAAAADPGWRGHIVNTASMAGLLNPPNMGVYNATKAALIHVTKQLALELAPKVRVNAVAPSVVRTRLAEALWRDHEDAVGAMHPLGRIGEPPDVAGAVLFLASDAASWITGATLPVDGGALLS